MISKCFAFWLNPNRITWRYVTGILSIRVLTSIRRELISDRSHDSILIEFKMFGTQSGIRPKKFL